MNILFTEKTYMFYYITVGLTQKGELIHVVPYTYVFAPLNLIFYLNLSIKIHIILSLEDDM